jgi:hypothetical protein
MSRNVNKQNKQNKQTKSQLQKCSYRGDAQEQARRHSPPATSNAKGTPVTNHATHAQK